LKEADAIPFTSIIISFRYRFSFVQYVLRTHEICVELATALVNY